MQKITTNCEQKMCINFSPSYFFWLYLRLQWVDYPLFMFGNQRRKISQMSWKMEIPRALLNSIILNGEVILVNCYLVEALGKTQKHIQQNIMFTNSIYYVYFLFCNGIILWACLILFHYFSVLHPFIP